MSCSMDAAAVVGWVSGRGGVGSCAFPAHHNQPSCLMPHASRGMRHVAAALRLQSGGQGPAPTLLRARRWASVVRMQFHLFRAGLSTVALP